jgi:lysophospholipase L1-like esterase
VVLLLEAAMRVFWPELFPRHIVGLYAPHPQLGHVLAPSRETAIRRPEYAVTVRTNSRGFRGAELPPKGAASVRIVCLGDWLTWGEGVEDDQTYPALMETALRRRYPATDIQIVNAGVPQYSTLDELNYLKIIAAELQADFIVVQFYAGDDFEQNHMPSSERHELRDGMLTQTESFTATTGPRWLTILNWLKHRSHLVHWVSERLGHAAMRANLLATLEQASSSHFSDEDAERAQELLAGIHAVGSRVGAPTLFVFAPEKMQVLARPQVPLRAASVVAAVAEETGAAFLDLTSVLAEQEDLERLYLNTVGTWKRPAYQLAAESVTRKIIALGWIDATQ